MPSKTFYNLPEEKKNKLIHAAMEEFCNHNFINVSINKIISNAGIPRGSFYMYFNDKEDLFEYILKSYSLALKNIVNRTLIINNGDIRNCFISLYDEIIKRMKGVKYQIFFNNIFFYLNLNREKFDYKEHKFYKEIKQNINTVNIESENLEFVFMMLMHILFVGIFDTLRNDENPKQRYLRKIDVICYGIYKR